MKGNLIWYLTKANQTSSNILPSVRKKLKLMHMISKSSKTIFGVIINILIQNNLRSFLSSVEQFFMMRKGQNYKKNMVSKNPPGEGGFGYLAHGLDRLLVLDN